MISSPLKASIIAILSHPQAFDWSTQGFGMMRTYLDSDKQFRLNIWDQRLAVPDVSIIHDHPWDFTSWIIGGEFRNVRFHEDPRNGKPFDWQVIQTGPGGGPDGNKGTIDLTAGPTEYYYGGDQYRQEAEEIHASFYESGTVTINDRRRRLDGEHARVFWPAGQQWVDAEPRQATTAEVVDVCATALKVLARG